MLGRFATQIQNLDNAADLANGFGVGRRHVALGKTQRRDALQRGVRQFDQTGFDRFDLVPDVAQVGQRCALLGIACFLQHDVEFGDSLFDLVFVDLMGGEVLVVFAEQKQPQRGDLVLQEIAQAHHRLQLRQFLIDHF